jgi:hypothetical protein
MDLYQSRIVTAIDDLKHGVIDDFQLISEDDAGKVLLILVICLIVLEPLFR